MFTHRLFTDVFMIKSEVRRTGSVRLALIQYHAIMAGVQSLQILVKRFSFELCIVISSVFVDKLYGECF